MTHTNNFITRSNKSTNALSINILLYTTIFAQSIAIPSIQIPIIFPLSLMIVVLEFAKKNLKVDMKQFYLYCIIMMCGLITYIFNYAKPTASGLSLAYLVFLYLLYIFTPNKNKDLTYYFLNSLRAISIFAIIQHILQLVNYPFFYFGQLLPDDFLIKGYAYQYEYPYGSGYFKPNGIFLLEPSFLSQFCALGFIVEWHRNKNTYSLFLFLLSIALSKSGTGILILLFWLLSNLPIKSSRTVSKKKLALGLLIFLCISIFAIYNIKIYSARILEISNQNTSAFIRFVAPILNCIAILHNASILDIMIGFGPGSSTRLTSNYDANYLTTIKSFLEYGLVFTIIFHLYIFRFIFKKISLPYRWPLICFVYIASGAMLQPQTMVILWLFQYIYPILQTTHEKYISYHTRQP